MKPYARSREGMPITPERNEAMEDMDRGAESRGAESRGIGWVDMHLLASTTVAGRVSLWSRDKRLVAVAAERGIAYTRAVA